MKEQLQLHREKIEQARAYMRELGIDLWIIRDRGPGDPSVPLLFGTPTTGDTFYLVTRDRLVVLAGEGDRTLLEDADLFDEVEVQTDAGLAAALSRRVSAIDPESIALNISSSNHLADGLTVGGYRSLLRMLG
ncbi:MAG: hypothetical protein ACOC1I_06580 [Spirochaetota bacterium]